MPRRPLLSWVDDEFPGYSAAAVRLIGHSHVLALAFGATALWLAVGVCERFPSEWLLLTNLVCTMVILLLLLLVQHAQKREMRAVQVKLDALITASTAGNHWIAAEQLDVDTIEAMRLRHHAAATGL